jgi:uncharacterized membrane protein required for colicin V production
MELAELPAVNWVDAVVALVVVGCALFGLLTGFVLQLAGIASVAAGVTASFLLAPAAAEAISPRWIESRAIAHVVAYMACFTIAASAVRLVAAFCSALLKRWELERYDRLAGLFAGALKGALLCTVGLLILGRLGTESLRAPVQGSLLGRHLVAAADWAFTRADGAEVSDRAEEAYERLEAIRNHGPDVGGLLEPDSGGDDDDADAERAGEEERERPAWSREP